jgi:hypothetical protein
MASRLPYNAALGRSIAAGGRNDSQLRAGARASTAKTDAGYAGNLRQRGERA